jgi:organic hydroperoxide reductase OsmC/OhrA
MSTYSATVEWKLDGTKFTDNRYSRRHQWLFDGGVSVPASSSPHVVPIPMSELAAVDPEEAFVASLSSCHMLWFLSIAAKHGFVVEKYRDQATGVMSKNAEGKLAMTLVTLHPEVTFSTNAMPTEPEFHNLHHDAHDHCFIATSVKTELRCDPVIHNGK